MTSSKLTTPLSITFAFVATHNHFVLDRGGKVFNRSAPIIKLPRTATEDDHLALLAWLNSSVACFWMKQVCFPKSSQRDVGDSRDRPERTAYEFAGTVMLPLPVPNTIALKEIAQKELIVLTRELESLAAQRAASTASQALARWKADSGPSLKEALHSAEFETDRALRQMTVLQEELDWRFYELLGLCSGVTTVRGEASAMERPFQWDSDDAPKTLAEPLRAEWSRRRVMLMRSPSLRVVEDAMFKRPWEGRRGVFGHGALTWDESVVEACRDWLVNRIEEIVRRNETSESLTEVERELLGDAKARAVLDMLSPTMGDNTLALLSELAERESVPFLAAQRHTDEGLAKRAEWERTWCQWPTETDPLWPTETDPPWGCFSALTA